MAATRKSSAAKSSTKSVSVELPVVSDKKSVTRFDVAEGTKNPALANAYVTHDALASIGGAPNGIRITITAL